MHWDKPFIILGGEGKTPIQKGWADNLPGSRYELEQIKKVANIGFIPPKGYCILDADNEEAMKKIEYTLSKLNRLHKVKSYKTTRGKHYVFKKPLGEYFDEKLTSQIGGTIFMPNDNTTSNIDVKSSSDKTKSYVKIKNDNVLRVDPEELLTWFNEDTPEIPYVFCISRKMKISFDDYKPGTRDDTFFRWVNKFRSIKWEKEQFLRFAVELSLIAGDEESPQDTVDWASQKWDSSVAMGDVKNFMIDYKDIGKSLKDELEEALPPEYFKLISHKIEVEKEEVIENENNLDDDSYIDQLRECFEWKAQKITTGEGKSSILKVNEVYDYVKLSNLIIEKTSLQLSEEDEQIWGMVNGALKPIKNLELYIKRFLIEKLGNIKPTIFSGVKTFIEGVMHQKEFDKNEFAISFKNTTFDAMEKKEILLSQKYMAQNIIPHNFIGFDYSNHQVEKEFMDDMMKRWTKGDELIERELYELIGISMTKYMGNEKIYFLLGSGCIDKDTEFFTGSGWKKISDYEIGDKVLEFDTKTWQANLTYPLEYHKYPATYWIKYEDINLNFTTCENHNMIYLNENNNVYQKINSFDLYNKVIETDEKIYIVNNFSINDDFNINENKVLLDKNNYSIEKALDGEFKYCFTTPKQTLVLRTNGKIWLTNNSNGKSFFLNFLSSLLGNDNISNEDLKELSKDPFSSVNLYGKLANINSDISSAIIEDTSMFKKIASGDRISSSHKGKDKFNFYPYATQIFGTNNVPYAKEQGNSDAIDRRLKIITFNSVVGKDIPASDVKKIRDRLFSRKVAEYTIARSLEVLHEALHSKFTESSTSKLALEKHQKETNNVYHFIEESGIIDRETTTQALQRYKEWCKQYDFRPLGLYNFVNKYIATARYYGTIIHKETEGTKIKERHVLIVESSTNEQ